MPTPGFVSRADRPFFSLCLVEHETPRGGGQGDRQVSVCVSDEGGGMSMGTAHDAFKYLWTSSGEGR